MQNIGLNADGRFRTIDPAPKPRVFKDVLTAVSRLVKILCVLLLILASSGGWYVYMMSYPHVLESPEWTTIESARSERSYLFEDFPQETRAIRYANAVVGMKGWCFAYVIDAPFADLHAFAESQLQPFGSEIVRTEGDRFPFNEATVRDLKKVYSVTTDWLLMSVPSDGTLYELADGFGPTLFIDEGAGMLYYVMTD